jgi:hypothetical protein
MPTLPSNFDASTLIGTATHWLVKSGLGGCDMPTLLAGLSRRLNARGIAIDRAGYGVLTLHPQIVSQQAVWLSADDKTTMTYFTP